VNIIKILETKDVEKYLIKRNLLERYKKAKKFILSGNIQQVNFKKRNPKGSGLWYFRINKQFRAIGYFDKDDFIVFEIDNHQ
jgi:hypothetical protein